MVEGLLSQGEVVAHSVLGDEALAAIFHRFSFVGADKGRQALNQPRGQRRGGAAPLGVLIGSLLFSMLADRIGRRPVLIGLTFYFAITALLTARTTSPQELLWVRFFSGIGLGGIMPNAVALSGEYSPHRARVLVMMLVGNFFNLGAALGGFLAAWLIPLYGWRSVFYFGGIIPLAISAAMLVLLPESLPFLALKGRAPGRLRRGSKRKAPRRPGAEAGRGWWGSASRRT